MGDYQLYRMLDSILENQQTIYDLLERINRKVTQEMSDLTTLTAEVQNNTAVDTSAITLLNGLAAQLALIANDPAAIAALAEELASSSAALAEAVVANTPVVVEVPVEPPVETPPV